MVSPNDVDLPHQKSFRPWCMLSVGEDGGLGVAPEGHCAAEVSPKGRA